MIHFIREAILYSAASALALAVDVGLLWLLIEHAEIHYLLAASLAFSAGTAVVYTLSVSAIFRHRRVADRRLEFAAFAAIGMLGLLTNLFVLKLTVDGLGAHYMVGKALSIIFTFSLNFGLRRSLLFSAPSSAQGALAMRISNE